MTIARLFPSSLGRGGTPKAGVVGCKPPRLLRRHPSLRKEGKSFAWHCCSPWEPAPLRSIRRSRSGSWCPFPPANRSMRPRVWSPSRGRPLSASRFWWTTAAARAGRSGAKRSPNPPRRLYDPVGQRRSARHRPRPLQAARLRGRQGFRAGVARRDPAFRAVCEPRYCRRIPWSSSWPMRARIPARSISARPASGPACI